MDSVLHKLGLEYLLQRFRDEKIEIETVDSLTDGEVKRLGVDTIGDRVRIRELCKSTTTINIDADRDSTGVDPDPVINVTPSLARRVTHERQLLFTPSTCSGSSRSRRGAVRDRGRKRKYRRSWTVTFVCLASRQAERVPSVTERQVLNNAGLGVKKITLYVDDDEQN